MRITKAARLGVFPTAGVCDDRRLQPFGAPGKMMFLGGGWLPGDTVAAGVVGSLRRIGDRPLSAGCVQHSDAGHGF